MLLHVLRQFFNPSEFLGVVRLVGFQPLLELAAPRLQISKLLELRGSRAVRVLPSTLSLLLRDLGLRQPILRPLQVRLGLCGSRVAAGIASTVRFDGVLGPLDAIDATPATRRRRLV